MAIESLPSLSVTTRRLFGNASHTHDGGVGLIDDG